MASIQGLRTVLLAVVACCFLTVDQVNADAVKKNLANKGRSRSKRGGWNYNINQTGGPDTWSKDYMDCGGVMQSPIHIESSHVLYDPELNMFDLADYKITEGVKMKLVNKGGHTAEVIYEEKDLFLKGGSLPDKYHLEQFHFHWGSTEDKGSEHMWDGKHYPMEMHIVHYQYNLPDVSVALPHSGGLAVLGFFFKIGKNNSNFEHLLKHFHKILEPDQEVEIEPFALHDLLPQKERIDYFRYFGSLTTPPCYESVIWSLATEPIEISNEQLSKFRMLHTVENRSLVDDYRPVQPRNYRTVLTTHWDFKTDGTDNASFITASKITVLTLVAICLSSLLQF